MQKLLQKFLILIVCFALPASAFAQLGASDTGLSDTVEEGYGVSESILSLPDFIGLYVIRPILGLTGTLIFALMTYAGFLWTTAQGDPKKVQKAKDILSECIVGTVILVGAYALANFVITQLSA
jgi:Type IV secretion system pilin